MSKASNTLCFHGSLLIYIINTPSQILVIVNSYIYELIIVILQG